ncbi:MAG TPA: CARDB domain-containing protein [Methylomirabilota bacterium]|jgi:subtilase family serine protease|nr:CARDB domain-containing protein [Methylomirabilota bacterium]
MQASSLPRMVGYAVGLALGLLLLWASVVFAQPQPNLVVARVTSPPAAAFRGDSFTITVTVRNVGRAAAGPSTTKFYLVSTTGPTKKNLEDGSTKNLKGTQEIGDLAGGVTETVHPTLTVYSDTLAGTYTVQACADSAKLVTETADSDNCATSVDTVTVP